MANIIFFDANELISFAKASIQANLADPADFSTPQTLLNNLLADLTSAGYTVRTTSTVVAETQQGYTSTQQQEALIQQFVNYAKNLDPQFVDPNVGPFVINYGGDPGENSIAYASIALQSENNVVVFSDDGGDVNPLTGC